MKRRLNRVSACKALLCFMAFGLASPPVSAAPVISAIETDAISIDVNNDGMANPGDTLKYTVTITNRGDASASNVQFTSTRDANTTPVGAVTVSPIAAGDNYSIRGSTPNSMVIDASNGLLANDLDPNGGGAGGTCTGNICSVTAQTGVATAQGGTVDISSDGSFTYSPAPGNSTTDTFTYTITDAETKTDTGTVSIIFANLIWYVDNTDQLNNGNGTSGSPFNNLASAASASGAGDMIYVFSGSGVAGQNSGLTLKNNQSLVGQEVDLVVTFNGTPETRFAKGTPPVITNIAGSGVTLVSNNTIKGLNIGDSSNPVVGTGIFGTNYGTLTVSDASVTTSGPTLASGGPALNLATGTLKASFGSLSSTNSSGRGLSITGSGIGSTLSVTGVTAISTPATEGVLLSTNAGTFNFAGLTITNNGNTGFSANNSGTVNVTGTANAIATTNGTALNLTNTTIGTSGITFRRISAGGGTNGIVLNNTGTSGGFRVTGTGTPGSGGTIQNSTGSGIKATNVTGLSLRDLNVTNNGSSTVDHAGEGIDLINLSGTASITNTRVSASRHHNLFLDNTSGTLTSLTITQSTFDNAIGGNGILFRAIGTAAVTSVSVTGSAFADNRDTGMDFNVNDTGNLTFKALNNNLTGHNSNAMNVFTGGTGGMLNGRITGNIIGNAAVGSGSASGNCMRININGGADSNLLIDGNTLRQCPNGRGIEIVGGDGTGGLDVTVTNNDVNPQSTNPLAARAAILVQSNCGAGGCNTVRSDVRGNTVPAASNATDLLPTYIALVETSTSTLELVDTAPASANCTAQLTSTNTGSASANAGCALIAGPINTPP